MIPDLHMRTGERRMSVSHKHWIVFLQEALPGIISLLLPFLAAAISVSVGAIDGSVFLSPLWVIFSSLWFLGSVMWLATTWTNYVLDILIVTSQRVIYVEQRTLFFRDIVTLHLEKEQNVSIEVRGVLATLFDFGTLRVETAGAMTELSLFENLPHPQRIKDQILTQSAICAREARLESAGIFPEGSRDGSMES